MARQSIYGNQKIQKKKQVPERDIPCLKDLYHLPSRNTAIHSLLVPLILLIKFGFILYDDELPGSQRAGFHDKSACRLREVEFLGGDAN